MDDVNQPLHYTQSAYQTLDEMIILFGSEATLHFCQLNAWKYRSRANYKGKFEEDMAKADRYLYYANSIKSKLMHCGDDAAPVLMSECNII